MAEHDLSGTVLDGRYKVIEPIAEGAMGSVYRGERLNLGRAVAIKVMHQELPDELASRQRFEREAKLMALLEHPNCVSVMDFGLHDDKPYLVMDLVRGTSLIELLDKVGQLDITRSCDIIRQVLSGLAHAHELGIVHRDIKPANIMISEKAGFGQQVRILDFGLARVMEGSTKLTTGIVVGTPNYMAPEQCKGSDVDARTDLYACGVMLFEMLAGRKPFVADDPIQVVRKHLMERPPTLASVAPTVDFGELEAVIAKALAKAPADRYDSAVEMAKAVEAAATKATKMSAAALFSRAVPEGAQVPPANQQATMSGWNVPVEARPPGASGAQPPGASGAQPPGVSSAPPAGVGMPPPSAANDPSIQLSESSILAASAVMEPVRGPGHDHAATMISPPPIPDGAATVISPPPIPDGAATVMSPPPLPLDGAATVASGLPPFGDSGRASLPPLPAAGPYVPPPTYATGPSPQVPSATTGPAAVVGSNLAGVSSGAPNWPINVPPTRPSAAAHGPGGDRPIAQLPLTKKQLMIGGGALGAVIVVIAIVAGGGGGTKDTPKTGSGSAAAVIEPNEDPVPEVVERANAHIAAEDYEQAVASLKRARKAHPDSAELAFLSGKANFGRLYWSEGIDDFRTAIELDASYKDNPDLLKAVLKGFITTPDVDDRIVGFMREIGPPFRPYLEETAEKHPKKAIRARARAELNARP